jgi:polysaccharide biosynthesis protein PslG
VTWDVAASPRKWTILLLVAVLAVLLWPSRASATGVGVVTDVTWGQPRADVDRELDLLRSAGVRWIRANVNWAGLEPNAKGQIDAGQLAAYDYAIDRARAAGFEVLMPISDGVPYWASADPGKHVDGSGNRQWNRMYPPADMGDYGDIVRFVVGHFAPKGVHTYEIWNEPNLVWFWASGPNPSAYVGMLKAGYRAAKAADSGSTVLLGGLSKSDFEYLEGVYRAGGGGFFDAVAVHPYTYGVDPSTSWNGVNAGEDPQRISKNAFPAIQEIKRTMDRNGDAGKQVWITEFGYSTTTQEGGVSEEAQASFLEKAYAYADRFPWVHSVFWYAARNTPFGHDRDEYEARFGLMTTDWRPKPSFDALRRYAAGAQSAGAAPPSVQPPAPPAPATPAPPPAPAGAAPPASPSAPAPAAPAQPPAPPQPASPPPAARTQPAAPPAASPTRPAPAKPASRPKPPPPRKRPAGRTAAARPRVPAARAPSRQTVRSSAAKAQKRTARVAATPAPRKR